MIEVHELNIMHSKLMKYENSLVCRFPIKNGDIQEIQMQLWSCDVLHDFAREHGCDSFGWKCQRKPSHGNHDTCLTFYPSLNGQRKVT